MSAKIRSLKTNAALNFIREAVSTFFPIITFTYVSHVLGAEKLGVYSFSQSVVNYFLLLAALGISTYAIREGQTVRDDRIKLRQFVSEVFLINLIMTIISYLLLWGLMLVWPKLFPYRTTIGIISLTILFTTIGRDWVNTLFEDYLFITIRTIIIQVLTLLCLLLFVKKPEDLFRYIFIVLSVNAVSTLMNLVHTRKFVRSRFTSGMHLGRHIKPMVTLFSNSLAMRVYLISDILILGILTTDHLVGVYTLNSRIYTALKDLINAVIMVTIPRFSYYVSHDQNEQYRNSYRETLSYVITLLVPVMVGLFFEAKNIILIMGGVDYLSGITVLRILSCAMFFAVGGCFFAHSVLIPNKQEDWFLCSTVIAAVVNVVLNLLLIPRFNINAAAVTTLLAEIIVFSISMVIGSRFIKISINIRDLVSSLLGGAAIAVVCTITNQLNRGFLVSFIAAFIFSAIAYFVVLLIMGNSVVKEFIDLIKIKLKRT